MDKENLLHKELAYRIIGVAMQVHNELGHGFMEKVYENAMMVLLRREGMKAFQQVPIIVKFLDEIVGEYFADIFVDDKVICELKSVDGISNVHRAQALNYLKATGLELAIILKFGKEKLEFERLVFQLKS
jgi:GxxExxY protein